MFSRLFPGPNAGLFLASTNRRPKSPSRRFSAEPPPAATSIHHHQTQNDSPIRTPYHSNLISETDTKPTRTGRGTCRTIATPNHQPPNPIAGNRSAYQHRFSPNSQPEITFIAQLTIQLLEDFAARPGADEFRGYLRFEPLPPWLHHSLHVLPPLDFAIAITANPPVLCYAIFDLEKEEKERRVLRVAHVNETRREPNCYRHRLLRVPRPSITTAQTLILTRRRHYFHQWTKSEFFWASLLLTNGFSKMRIQETKGPLLWTFSSMHLMRRSSESSIPRFSVPLSLRMVTRPRMCQSSFRLKSRTIHEFVKA
ncbi:hypothetical protein PHJA_002366000 [Phtheirospermum japonicum]|uniref:Uncharacterized protein n=1 Tax=Phtheirospermum japonicum TaxID=374723 RepID=A0A830CQN3_9LAMI|nr:hypothetical protein PHJA_002366000 [Phtheirospermum japonicum]